MSDKKYCSECEEFFEPEFMTRSCIAQYGSVVFAKGYCPCCGKVIVKEHMVDDEGMHPPKRDWRYGR